MKHVVWVLVTASLVVAGGAYADQMVITYRSGRVQILHLDEPGSAIQGITYRADNSPKSEAPYLQPKAGTAERSTITPAPEEQGTGAAQAVPKSPVHIEWAQPLE